MIIGLKLGWLFRYSDYFVGIIVLLCIYGILQIKFDVAFWIGDVENADECNEILLNLSYSFLAAYLFYMMTVMLPYWKMKYKCRAALQKKIHLIVSNYQACAESVLPFPNKLPENLTRDVLEAIFKAFSYQEPCRLKILGTNVPAITYIKLKQEENKKLATELLEYKNWLSSDMIAAIEEIRNSDLNNILLSLMSPALADKLSKDENSRAMLGGAVYDIWMAANKIRI